MDRPLARILSPALAALFVLLVALTAAHYRFPYEPAARWVVRNIEETAPVRVRFDAPAPGRPFLCRIPGPPAGPRHPGRRHAPGSKAGF